MRAATYSAVRREISRFPYKERTRMLGSPTTRGRSGTRICAPERLAFRQDNGVGAPNRPPFAAQWPAYTHPCQRFAAGLAASHA